MSHTPDITRPPRALVDALALAGAATCGAELKRLGIRDSHICGPVCRTPDRPTIAGPALTLQFLPIREDVYVDEEYGDVEAQLHRHALYHAQPGDVVVVDARGAMNAGVFGEMMLTYFAGRGGLGVVIDGCLRDWPEARKLDLGYWIRGTSPNYHTQTDIFPHGVNVPIGCGGRLVLPGDIIVADADGAVVVPASLAEQLLERATKHAEWEDFSRLRLAQGGDLRKYYPLREDAHEEYEAWRAENPVTRKG